MKISAPLHPQLHDHSVAADGTPIAVVGVPNLPATKITSLRFPMARMLDGPAGQVIVAAGAGFDPAWATMLWSNISINVDKAMGGHNLSNLSSVGFADATVQTTAVKIVNGNYVGNASVNRVIPHGLGRVPKMVLIADITNYIHLLNPLFGASLLYALISGASSAIGTIGVTAMDNTNFRVGNATSYPQSANANGVGYYWVAIG